MSEKIAEILTFVKEHDIRFADLKFTDTIGKEQHITIPVSMVNERFFEEGKGLDGSSIRGWKSIGQSDMLAMPDPFTMRLDPFRDEPTISIRCDIVEPSTLMGYERDPRSVAKRAEGYLQSTGIGDTAYFGPEPEFFVFDDVRWQVNDTNTGSMSGAFYNVDSYEAAWNSSTRFDAGNLGHRPAVKGGYFPVPPVDSAHDLRSAMALAMEDMGLVVETHHHEVATGCQNEIATRFNSLTKKADELQILKYVVHNVAHAYGKTATFMPKPLVGDNGNGMHCHQSISKNGENLFSGNQYAGMSELGLYYIGGIIKHAKALTAFTNPATNSYKRLVPGFEAPVLLAYSSCNRSAAIRIPYVAEAKARRIEVRFPDPMANPYLAFSAMLMAGLDGIKNKIHPGDPMDKNLYDLPPEEMKDIPTVSFSLQEAIDHLQQDHEFLLAGDVFSEDLIRSYIELKKQEVDRLRMATHPVEFDMYYSG